MAPQVELTEEMLTNLTIGVRIGEYCSIGTLDVETMRQKGRTLVWP